MTQSQQQEAARKFAQEWKSKGYEKGESQKFWLDLLCNVFGVQNFAEFISFEDQVKLDHTSFIDGYIPSSKVLIEQKSVDKDLRSPVRQSDGSFLNPFQQAKRYVTELPVSRHPRWVVTCNFKSFLVYDMENPAGEPEEILLENLEKEYYRLSFLAVRNDAASGAENEHIKRELEISKKAGDIIGEIYDAILLQYKDAENPGAQTLRSLNMLCVRIVFCLYAEDAGIFGHKSIFGDYLKSFEAKDLRRALLSLFQVLDTKIEERDPYLEENLAQFPYVNGGLFTEEDRTIPQLTDEIKELLVRHASSEFDWSEISPTIFGAIFESTLNPETRRTGGMHYTSIENIHKVIDPLFFDGLKEEFAKIKQIRIEKTRIEKCREFHRKLGTLKFLDPACGSGNFLTETYLSLRKLGNECIRLEIGSQNQFDFDDSAIQVKIHQFYGIEINDFAAVVAKTALWIAESQMMKETSKILDRNLDFLPLKSYANIAEGNALRMDWNTIGGESENRSKNNGGEILPLSPAASASSVTPSSGDTPQHPAKYDYIMGNPPFVGNNQMNKSQREDLMPFFPNNKTLDYVCCWYIKAAELIQNTNTHCAFVSTNSICQGEQVSLLWKTMFNDYGICINFAYQTFKWSSESNQKAAVHCVIVGFSDGRNQDTGIRRLKTGSHPELVSGAASLPQIPNQGGRKFIFDEKGEKHIAKNINGYLIDAPDVFIESRSKPQCNVLGMRKVNQPTDGGNLIIEADDYDDFIKKEPSAKKFIKPLIGAQEFINNKKRYCLWLVDASPSELRKMPLVMKRLEQCREFRLKSSDKNTVKLAETPHLFRETVNPPTALVIPSVSSENRRYVPIGFIDDSIIVTNLVQIIPNAGLFLFGVITSSVHMAWMRAVCGRLKSDYRYSKDIVYNNFPFVTPEKNPSGVPNPCNVLPHCTQAQADRIEAAAQAILGARAKYPDCSLADLYDELAMPPDLRKAHKENDRAVLQAYGFPQDATESEVVAELFNLYKKMCASFS